MACGTDLNDQEKIEIFKSFFSGLPNVYGTYDPSTGRARQVKAQVTNEVLLAHLTGKQPYGVYLLTKDRTRAIAVDFDTQDRKPPTQFVARAVHYGLSAHIERSKSKGYHVWMFFNQEGVVARKARLVVRHILEEIEQPQTEIFPKQDEIGVNTHYGNFINAPLFGTLVLKGKTAFVDPTTFNPYSDQWNLLEFAKRHNESALDEIIEINDLFETPQHPSPSLKQENDSKGTFTLPPCARKMLRDGVTQFQRVGCFRLAVHFKRLGLPQDLALATLKTWARKNRPENGKGVLRDSEIISQTSYAYDHPYTGYGCDSPVMEPHCEPTCPVKKWREEQSSKHSKSSKVYGIA
ncbi:MAG: hypothetical protein JRL30_13425 [Deltaproteobacteria bacterium]|nr:hypothetical protein [Deltaproteobacteria bacterium]